jgi:hypothetical protein
MILKDFAGACIDEWKGSVEATFGKDTKGQENHGFLLGNFCAIRYTVSG